LHQGATAFRAAWYGQGRGDIALDNVHCDGSEAILLECNHDYEIFMHNCRHSEDAGVKCNRDEDNKPINASIIKTLYTALITWIPQNTTHYPLSSYLIECFSREHHIRMLVNDTTFNLELAGLLSFMTYNCCVSTVYANYYRSYSYTARRDCTEITTILPPTVKPSEIPKTVMQSSESPWPTVNPEGISTIKPSENPTIQLNTSTGCETRSQGNVSSSGSADTIGGVLGFIIAILLILLALSGAALVYLLRLKYKE
jgi:hypothetical protein